MIGDDGRGADQSRRRLDLGQLLGQRDLHEPLAQLLGLRRRQRRRRLHLRLTLCDGKTCMESDAQRRRLGGEKKRQRTTREGVRLEQEMGLDDGDAKEQRRAAARRTTERRRRRAIDPRATPLVSAALDAPPAAMSDVSAVTSFLPEYVLRLFMTKSSNGLYMYSTSVSVASSEPGRLNASMYGDVSASLLQWEHSTTM